MPAGQGRRGRITRSADFDRVYRSGRSHASRVLVLHTFPRGDDQPARLGLSVSRKVGGAVDRNRLKRLVKEAFSLIEGRVTPGIDVVVVARKDASGFADANGLDGVKDELVELLGQAGAMTGEAGTQ